MDSDLSRSVRGLWPNHAVDYAGKVAFHNLEYFTTFSQQLRERTRSGRLEAFVTGLVGAPNAEELTRKIPELFE
jgi:queuine/archaeosine tRNA-ribosyltransferase